MKTNNSELARIPTIELAQTLKRARRDTKVTTLIAFTLRKRAIAATQMFGLPLPRQLSCL